MADLKITELPPLSGALLQADDPVAVADVSASETKKITAKDLVQGAIALIDDGSIPGSKVSGGLSPGSIGTDDLADGCVTAAKLADSSTATLQAGLPAAGAYIGQLTVNTTDNKAYVWSGSAWLPFKAGGNISSIVGDATGNVRIDVIESNGVATLNGYLADSTGPGQVLIGPTAGAGPVTLRPLIGPDLPLATDTTPGVAQVGGSGLAMNGNQIVIDNAVGSTEGTGVYGVVEYDAQGLVTSGRAITSGDLPAATLGQPGAVQPGSEFSIGANGTLLHANSVAPGTATKVTFNGQGHVTAGQALTEADIPPLSGSKITSGPINGALIASRSITSNAIADYCNVLMQNDNPGGGYPLGQLWFMPANGQLYVYAAGSGPENIWLPVGMGVLTNQNLRWGGMFNALTQQITLVTTWGLEAGLVAGNLVPDPSDSLAGIYLVCQIGGNNMNVQALIGQTFTEGDWAICMGATGGWQYVDVTGGGGGGGGGGVDYLKDLLDTEIGVSAARSAPQTRALVLEDGQPLTWRADIARWVNSDLIDGNKVRLKSKLYPAGTPGVNDLIEGELAIVTNANNPGLYFKDNNNAIREIHQELVVGSSPPTNVHPGLLWYNSDIDRLYYYQATGNWELLAYPGEVPTVQPSNPQLGDIFFNTVAGTIQAWDGSQWVGNNGVEEAPTDGRKYLRQMGGWVAFVDPVYPVTGVNGQTGDVVIDLQAVCNEGTTTTTGATFGGAVTVNADLTATNFRIDLLGVLP